MEPILVWTLLTILMIEDLRNRKISMWMLAFFFLLGLTCFLFGSGSSVKQLLLSLSVGAAMLILSLGSQGAVGMGDGLLLMDVGLFLGWKETFTLLLGGLFLSSLYGVFLLIYHRENRKKTLPFVPFLWGFYTVTAFCALLN